jgi:hypothetical protein
MVIGIIPSTLPKITWPMNHVTGILSVARCMTTFPGGMITKVKAAKAATVYHALTGVTGAQRTIKL